MKQTKTKMSLFRLQENQLNAVKAGQQGHGEGCGCACYYADKGGSSNIDNAAANDALGIG